VLDRVEDGMLGALSTMSDAARPSMGQDIRKGRRTEIEYLNGLVVRRGAEVGIDAPANAGLVKAVTAVETGKAPPAPERAEGF
jgi:2-dehydropantoate 2-reductase